MTAATPWGDPPRVGAPPRLPPYLGADQSPTADPAGARHGPAAGPAPPADQPSAGRPPAAGRPVGPRPFVLTCGRVADDASGIGLETQVTANLDQPAVALPADLRSIVALCGQPISVAEISARLRLHLGVTRVLVSDLQAAGHVVVHVEDAANPRSVELILRVMHGLRTIS